jgi:hypothetical protein
LFGVVLSGKKVISFHGKTRNFLSLLVLTSHMALGKGKAPEWEWRLGSKFYSKRPV